MVPREREPAPVSPTSPPAAAPAAEEEEELYDDASVSRQPQPPATSVLGQGLPRRPPSDDEDEDDQNWDGRSHLFGHFHIFVINNNA